MNYTEFLKVVDKLKENCNSFGNQVLYNMAKVADLNTKNKLADAMWLIGRSYAASPQRRSYGSKKDSFPVRPDNDGRGQFFATIAEEICDFSFPTLPDFSYDGIEQDMDALEKSVNLVLDFNLKLSRAIENFDGAPEEVHCTNHISFCSKFLHFYYPEAVFIMDNYAQAGANRLFGNRSKGHFAYLCDPDNECTYHPLQMNTDPKEYAFEEDIYDAFPSSKEIDQYVDEIAQFCAIETQYNNRRDYNARGYITHCVRSYLLGEELKDIDFCPKPRLVDTVFLNIKGNLSKTEIDYFCKLGERYEKYNKQYEDYELAKELQKKNFSDK